MKSGEPDFIQTDPNEKDITEHKSGRYKTGKIISTQTFLDNKSINDVNVSRRDMLKEDFLINHSIVKVTMLESVYQFRDDCSCNCTRKEEICCLNFWLLLAYHSQSENPSSCLL